MLKFFTLLLLIWATVDSSPFQLTKIYIEEFKKGLEELLKIAEEHQVEENSYNPLPEIEEEALKNAELYDFIIIGGGRSGAVIANRLTERPEWKVLLLEAGSPEDEISKVPANIKLLQNTPYNWGYITTPQKHWCYGMIEKKCAVIQGRGLGGSSAINGLLYSRGNAKDYDLWADQGNDGWCNQDVLKYFKKAEDAHLAHFDNGYHNRGGPFHIENPTYLTGLHKKFLEAGQEIGLDTIDYNGKEQLGLGVAQVGTKHGQIHSTSEAYLESAMKRHNLVVRPLSQVIQIIISPHTKEATGVKYLHDDKLHIAKADKEVILSAGSVNTPQILMLSGIGPKEHLESLGIPVIDDLHVGLNLKEQVAFLGLEFLYNSSVEEIDEEHPIVEYLKEGTGRLTSTGLEATGFIKTDLSKDTSKYPDVQLLFIVTKIPKKSKLNPMRYKDEIIDSVWEELQGHDIINLGIVLPRPKSTGSVTLKDKDPLHHPLIDLNQLSDPDDYDIATILAGIRSVLALVETEAMKHLELKINSNPVKGCETLKWGSDEYWKCAIRHLSVGRGQLTGTARMGPSTDKEAVVDNKLRVYGVHKLRVADASVIPVGITGHTTAAAIMIGEKASDLIKEDWTIKA